MKSRLRRRSARPDTAHRPRRIANILAVGLALGTVAAFLAEGLTGSRGALIAGNVAATLLGIVLLRRR